MKIKICKHFPKTQKFYKKLTEAFPNEKIIIKSCIGMCKICKKQPVAKVDGAKMKGKSISKILNHIKKL